MSSKGLGRNNALTRIAGQLRRLGFNRQEIDARLMVHPVRSGLPASEVRRISGSMAKKPVGSRSSPSTQPDPMEELAGRWHRPVEALMRFGASADGGTVYFPMRTASGELTGYRLRRGDCGTFRNGAKAISKRAKGRSGEDPCNALMMPWPFPPDGPVLIVEGEHDGVAAVLDIPATIALPGSSPGAFALGQLEKMITGRDVFLAADNDPAGEAFAEELTSRLSGRATSLRQLRLPEGQKDLADALDAAEDWRAALRGLMESAEVTDMAPATEDGDGGWVALIPLGGGTDHLPRIAAQQLGGFAGEFAVALAEATETPPELATLCVLGTCSAAVARRMEVEINPGYREPGNLWLVSVLDPGNRKSAVHAAAVQPLVDWEARQSEILEPSIRRTASEHSVLEARVKEIRIKGAKAKDHEEARQLAEEAAELEEELPEVPTPPRLWTGDATPERLAVLMQENEESFFWATSEAGIFDDLAGRYAKGGVPNLDLCLKAWSGDAARVDRQGRPSVYLRRPLLTISATVQPAALSGLAARPGFSGRGLVERFLFAMPASPLGYRRGDSSPMPEALRDKYARGVEALLDLPAAPEGGVWTVHLSQEARGVWREFWQAVEVSMRPGKRCESLTSMAGKLPGQAARIALVLHAVKHAEGVRPWEVPLNAETMESALDLAAVLMEHTIAAMETMGTDAATALAVRTWRWITQGRRAEFTKRDAWQELKGSFSTAAEVEQTLARLTDRGYISEPQQPLKKGRGRPSSPVYYVRPDIVGGWS